MQTLFPDSLVIASNDRTARVQPKEWRLLEPEYGKEREDGMKHQQKEEDVALLRFSVAVAGISTAPS
jgi:hypothetical protein